MTRSLKDRHARRRAATIRAKGRKLQRLEWVMSDERYRRTARLWLDNDRDESRVIGSPTWRERSRALVRRGRSVRQVVNRTWADKHDRHDLVCWEMKVGHEKCSAELLMLGGTWRQFDESGNHQSLEPIGDRLKRSIVVASEYGEFLDSKWVTPKKTPCLSSDPEKAAQATKAIEAAKQAADEAAEAERRALVPLCDECGVLVVDGEQGWHKYGHSHQKFNDPSTSISARDRYTTQSYGWEFVHPALHRPLQNWLRRRDWSTHSRKIKLEGGTFWHQPRRLHLLEKPFKPELRTKRGSRNYTII